MKRIDKLGWTQRKALAVICGAGALVSMAYVTNGGLFLLDIVDYYINNIALSGSCLIELFLMAWVFKKLSELCSHVNSMSEIAVGS